MSEHSATRIPSEARCGRNAASVAIASGQACAIARRSLRKERSAAGRSRSWPTLEQLVLHGWQWDASSQAPGESMEKTQQLEDIAANLDDISLILDEIKDEVPEQERTNAKALQKIEDGVTRAADAVDEAVESASDSDS